MTRRAVCLSSVLQSHKQSYTETVHTVTKQSELKSKDYLQCFLPFADDYYHIKMSGVAVTVSAFPARCPLPMLDCEVESLWQLEYPGESL